MIGTDNPRRPAFEIAIRFVWLFGLLTAAYELAAFLAVCIDMRPSGGALWFEFVRGSAARILEGKRAMLDQGLWSFILWLWLPPLLLAGVLAFRRGPLVPRLDRWIRSQPHPVARFAVLFVAVAVIYDLTVLVYVTFSAVRPSRSKAW